MKLRNKKTGEIFDAIIREKGGGGSYSLIVCDIKAYEQSKSTLDATHSILGEYDTLAKFNKDWEDYKPAEPLIKDEKIRKAVRLWAEANLMKKVMFEYIENEGSYFNDCSCSIRFYEDLHLTNRHEYTIEELCGEEKE
jgi:hypothetical protein